MQCGRRPFPSNQDSEPLRYKRELLLHQAANPATFNETITLHYKWPLAQSGRLCQQILHEMIPTSYGKRIPADVNSFSLTGKATAGREEQTLVLIVPLPLQRPQHTMPLPVAAQPYAAALSLTLS